MQLLNDKVYSSALMTFLLSSYLSFDKHTNEPRLIPHKGCLFKMSIVSAKTFLQGTGWKRPIYSVTTEEEGGQLISGDS